MAANMKGLASITIPNGTLDNRRFLSMPFMLNRKRKASLSLSLMPSGSGTGGVAKAPRSKSGGLSPIKIHEEYQNARPFIRGVGSIKILGGGHRLLRAL